MNKFEKVRFHVDLVEAASKAAIEVAWYKLRYASSYVNCSDEETPEWYNDEWLEAHLTEDGREYLKMAREFADQLDKLL